MKFTLPFARTIAVFLTFGSIGLAHAGTSYLKCGLNEVEKDGTLRSFYINACSRVNGGTASVHFSPDGDDFPYEDPSFEAKIENEVLTLTLDLYRQPSESSQFSSVSDTSRSVRVGNIELDCSVTADPHYANGVDVCR